MTELLYEKHIYRGSHFSFPREPRKDWPKIGAEKEVEGVFFILKDVMDHTEGCKTRFFIWDRLP